MAADRAAAQEDVLTRARAAVTSGHRAEALAMLEAHLATNPRDVDGRLLYGLVLSWEGRYDEARTALRQVLDQAPDYTDARVALMNVEYWSGHSADALDLARQILVRDSGNVTARAMRERLEAASRPWWVKTDYTLDTFSDGSSPWQESTVTLTRATPIGSAIGRVSFAHRLGENDQLVEAEYYPRFRTGTYAYLEVGVSPNHTLYPKTRYSFDVYQSLGHGFEVSGGARFLNFSTLTQIYVGTLTKYVGNWMVTGKVFQVSAPGGLSSNSFWGVARRYYGQDGTSYVGVSYGNGLSHTEIYSSTDLLLIHANTVRGEFDHEVGTRFRVSGSAAASHQHHENLTPFWQTTINGGFAVRF
jgi:YaiO family outer membrane protein